MEEFKKVKEANKKHFDKIKEIDLVIHWAIIALITQIPLAIYLGYLVKRF